jgi:hypothetical protein
MVKTYLRRRYTKQRMSTEITNRALEIFEDLHVFSKTKVIHCHLCCLKNEKLYQINSVNCNPP